MIKLGCLLIMTFIISCQNNSNIKMKRDKFIEKYQNENFSEFKNTFICVRQNNIIELIYMVGKFEGKLPMYFVTYNIIRSEVTQINKSALKEANIDDYFTDEEIKSLISNFRKYDFYLLGVDTGNNVFINPYNVNSPPYFLRLKTLTNEKSIKKGYIYDQYKNNWYINNR